MGCPAVLDWNDAWDEIRRLRNPQVVARRCFEQNMLEGGYLDD
jgi:hypothetical protein